VDHAPSWLILPVIPTKWARVSKSLAIARHPGNRCVRHPNGLTKSPRLLDFHAEIKGHYTLQKHMMPYKSKPGMVLKS
jgi:hypothetical protein